ncbi:MAG TPA: hypothetical protein VJ484_06480, partial [Lysobacter sp.]|nr:hypothetical protein [Lysobacter sp.]
MMRRTLLIGLVLAGQALASTRGQRPPAVVPSDANVVIERLPPGYARLMPAAYVAASVATSPSSMTRIQQLLATAARTGDARLAARAESMLAGFPLATRDPNVLRARAYSAQHRHDFAGAVRQLDTLMAGNPRDGDARLARAQINLVRGHLDQARADCAALVLGVDAGRGLLCVAMLALRTGDYSTAARAADRWLHDSARHDESWRYALRLRAEIAARAGDADADARFRRALAAAPDDVRTLA